MTPEQCRSYLAISGCHDDDLQEKMLDIPSYELDMTEIMMVSTLYESNVRIQSTLAGNFKRTVDVKKTEADKGARPKELGARPKRPFNGKCNICAKHGHLAKECRSAKDKLQCDDCQGKLPVPHNTGAFLWPQSKEKRLSCGNKMRATGAKSDKKTETNKPTRWSDDEVQEESCMLYEITCERNTSIESSIFPELSTL